MRSTYPRNSHILPLNLKSGLFSVKARRMYVRNGAMPVPVASMMIVALGSSGINIAVPTGPVIATLSPGWRSQRKLEHTPLTSLPSSSSYTSRFTDRDTVLPSPKSPCRVDAIEYRRTLWGLPLASTPGAMTPMDWPSRYGTFPSWFITMCIVSPGASLPTSVPLYSTVALYGVFGRNKFRGTPSRFAAIVRPATAAGAGAETGADSKAGEEPAAKVDATDPRERHVDDGEAVRAAIAAAGTKATMMMGRGGWARHSMGSSRQPTTTDTEYSGDHKRR